MRWLASQLLGSLISVLRDPSGLTLYDSSSPVQLALLKRAWYTRELLLTEPLLTEAEDAEAHTGDDFIEGVR